MDRSILSHMRDTAKLAESTIRLVRWAKVPPVWLELYYWTGPSGLRIRLDPKPKQEVGGNSEGMTVWTEEQVADEYVKHLVCGHSWRRLVSEQQYRSHGWTMEFLILLFDSQWEEVGWTAEHAHEPKVHTYPLKPGLTNCRRTPELDFQEYKFQAIPVFASLLKITQTADGRLQSLGLVPETVVLRIRQRREVVVTDTHAIRAGKEQARQARMEKGRPTVNMKAPPTCEPCSHAF